MVEVMRGVYACGALPHLVEAGIGFADDQPKESRHLFYEEAPELFDAMRAAVPVEGTDIFEIFSVAVHPGREIKPHRHPEWVALFYPDPGSTPVGIGDGIGILLRPGELIVIAPEVLHSVPRNESGKLRKSIAMKVKPCTSPSAGSPPPRND